MISFYGQNPGQAELGLKTDYYGSGVTEGTGEGESISELHVPLETTDLRRRMNFSRSSMTT
jgi:hypothetical protein